MNIDEKIKMFNDVFAPKTGEQVLFLVDIPHNKIADSQVWKDRREMAHDWYNILKEMGEEKGFTVDWKEFKATGVHNAPIPPETGRLEGLLPDGAPHQDTPDGML